jgi:hypothetical protein
MGCCTVGVKNKCLHATLFVFISFIRNCHIFCNLSAYKILHSWLQLFAKKLKDIYIYRGYKFTLAVMLFCTEPKIFALQKLQCVCVCVCVDLYIFRFVTMQNVRNLHSDTCWLTFARLSVGTDCVLCMIFAGICTVRFNTTYSILPHSVFVCVRTILTRQNHYFPLQHSLITVQNGCTLCTLWGANRN